MNTTTDSRSLTYHDLRTGLRRLDLDPALPVIVHASLSAFGGIEGGAESLLEALMATSDSIVMPAFTYKTMIIPEEGPPENGIRYGSGGDLNRLAEFHHPDMPADRLMGALAEACRLHPHALRSGHPILSFCGIHAAGIIRSQTLQEPLAPIQTLMDHNGWVLLLGVDQRVNTSIHYAEKLAGRRQFTRWALTPEGVVACPNFPGCSDGFNALNFFLQDVVRTGMIGPAEVQAVPVAELVRVVREVLALDPLALLCDRPDCERCNEIRHPAIRG